METPRLSLNVLDSQLPRSFDPVRHAFFHIPIGVKGNGNGRYPGLDRGVVLFTGAGIMKTGPLP